MIKIFTSGNDDKAAFGLLVAAAVAKFEVISEALSGFYNTLFANFLPASAEILPKLLKKLLSPSACIVFSITIIDFFLPQTTHFPTNNLVSRKDLLSNAISPTMFYVPPLCF